MRNGKSSQAQIIGILPEAGGVSVPERGRQVVSRVWLSGGAQGRKLYTRHQFVFADADAIRNAFSLETAVAVVSHSRGGDPLVLAEDDEDAIEEFSRTAAAVESGADSAA